jgi:regulator of cell morphogenesis and NO signaling
MNNVFIDVTVLEPRMKHPTIFNAFDTIAEGSSVVLHNDHDPRPLYYQLLGERGNCFSWTYLLNGPEIWKVEIKKNEKTTESIGEIAAKDMRKAELLKKLGIDFCCGGKRSLEEACLEKGLDIVRVKQELEDTAKQASSGTQMDFSSFSPSFLADYVVNVHHNYVRKNAPLLYELSEKVAAHHGPNNPSLISLREKTHDMLDEILTHMKKEEMVLFPYIKQLETSNGKMSQPAFGSVSNPISMMEHDHVIVGELSKEIRNITRGYTLPSDSCNSVGLLYSKLEEFEGDLLQHIHLENNILFPKALKMEE